MGQVLPQQRAVKVAMAGPRDPVFEELAESSQELWWYIVSTAAVELGMTWLTCLREL